MCTNERWERQLSNKEVGWGQTPEAPKDRKRSSDIICWLKNNDISIRFQSCDLLELNKEIIRCKMLREGVDIIHLSESFGQYIRH